MNKKYGYKILVPEWLMKSVLVVLFFTLFFFATSIEYWSDQLRLKTVSFSDLSHRTEQTKEQRTFTIDMSAIDKLDELIEQENIKSTVQGTIYGMALDSFVNWEVAQKIAECESGYDPYAQNKNSSAKGVYQFTDKTWAYIKATGHQFDYQENIKQFLIWFPIHPEWWSASKKCWNK